MDPQKTTPTTRALTPAEDGIQAAREQARATGITPTTRRYPQVGQEVYIRHRDEDTWIIATVTQIGTHGFFRYRPTWSYRTTYAFNPKKMQWAALQETPDRPAGGPETRLQARHAQAVKEARAKLTALDAWVEHFHAMLPAEYDGDTLDDLLDLCDHLDEFLETTSI